MSRPAVWLTEQSPHTVLGVTGEWVKRQRHAGALYIAQVWRSELRRSGLCERMRVEIRFDDQCGNRHHTFAVTCDIFDAAGKDIGGGAAHDEITRVFPELAPLIHWHLVSTDGPMHYIWNTLHHAGDRDHNGLRAGESRQMLAGGKTPMWELRAVDMNGSPFKQASKPDGKPGAPVYTVETLTKGDAPPPAPVLAWMPCLQMGEGKARDLDAARRCACWPDATDEQLTAEPAALRAALEARLPALLAEFRAVVESIGFFWE